MRRLVARKILIRLRSGYASSGIGEDNPIDTVSHLYKWWVLLLCGLANFLAGLSWMSLPVLFDEISRATGRSI
uniref:Uncharacterized protein n=1 Tax=Candidatus Kentrum sp. TC TaxID=2126339 RepID=A0A450ZQ13_9GAMM|nr:MAG: hypothetical protein BECKTC1821F_GA0114240_100824 [Candidatus Kentron sp. TC]